MRLDPERFISVLTEPAAAQLGQGRQAGGQGMLLQPYTSRVVTENQAGNVIPDNAVPVQKAKASISTRNRTLINEILMRWENSFAMHQGGTTGRSPHGVKQNFWSDFSSQCYFLQRRILLLHSEEPQPQHRIIYS